MIFGLASWPLALIAIAALGAPPRGNATDAAKTGAVAAEVRLEVSADRTSITVGDPIALTIRLSYPRGTQVTSFDPERGLGSLVVLDRRTEPPRRLEPGGVEEVRILRITTYEVGNREVPALEAAYVEASGAAGSVKSASIPFEVASVLAPDETRPADIKPPAMLPGRPLWPWALGALAAALGAAVWFWRRRRSPGPAEAALGGAPPRPPHEVAYAELERLLSSALLENGRLKEFYIELAEIEKRYLSARFGVETFERTSFEIIEALRSARTPVKITGAAGEFFASCDLVKFAKDRPGPEETRATVGRAYRLVDETRPSPPPAPDEHGLALAGAPQGQRQGAGR